MSRKPKGELFEVLRRRRASTSVAEATASETPESSPPRPAGPPAEAEPARTESRFQLTGGQAALLSVGVLGAVAIAFLLGQRNGGRPEVAIDLTT